MKISYGNSRMEKTWKNNDISWEAFCQRVSQTKITTETVDEYRKMTKAQQDQIKDVGGYVAGHKQQEKIRVRIFDPETASVRQTEMYVEGFKAKLKKDTSYKGLWIVSFTLKEL